MYRLKKFVPLDAQHQLVMRFLLMVLVDFLVKEVLLVRKRFRPTFGNAKWKSEDADIVIQ